MQIRLGRVRDHAAALDAAALAREALDAATTREGHSADVWNRIVAFVESLDTALRARTAQELRRLHPKHRADEHARPQVLRLLTAVGADLPGDPLAAERTAELERFGLEPPVSYGNGVAAVAGAELAAGRPLSAPVVAYVRRCALETYSDRETTALARKLTDPVLSVGEQWAERALAHATDDDAWQALLAHAATATSAKPTAKWDAAALALVEPLGAEAVRTAVLDWLPLAGRPRTFELNAYRYGPDTNLTWDPFNANALRGLTWILALLPAHPDTARALGALVETALKKVPGLGPVNPKVANAGVNALARIDSEPALAELARLATRLTYKATVKLLEAALDARATAMGLTREEIEELAVPAYGLTEVGRSETRLGDVTARLEVRGTKAVLGWVSATGKSVKSVPAAVRRDHADELKELKAAVKDIDKMLSAQVERLDRQFLARRVWSHAAWRERYLDHPLVGALARRLLWTVDGTPAGFADGELRTLTDDPVTTGTEVTLWHPVGRDPAEVVAWRDWLERHKVTQPFKQAHREVYLLTDAERATGTYSNRFAAHIVRQHQFHSLAAVRGWRNKLRLCVDDEAPPATRELPQWGLRAEYWIEGEGQEYGVDTTESGSYLRLRTDQVRFYPIDAPENSAHCCGGEYRMWLRDGAEPVEPLPLTAIPELVLSEVLRDVDLFVGVASVGNDPTWQDGGPGGRFREYWTSYGFGELNQSAETRRALLERLVPRLAIADRCHLEGRFLHVKGELHTYKIHLGSGNILMTPNDQYLCIVPKSGGAGADTGYLPFEGDRVLAVVLSKALLLAEDTKITDPTILSQIRR
ncbi:MULTISPECIES: DUF4132 domain-containing protein [unclassified Streptomyces]|uniref:DUF4132 domain-containing protein n=1 Tax=unclassified Streptomyces TaxID=2593676 RepID=UPI000DBAB252|nr:MULTISPECIES: DUF4132 domain-containing protein [unclassified Streptomyces]MYT68672.1 DUF4132 domain-containing protein [Streptomyces sp. SID8367]RAJ86344.1 uncharacterized protein DUF4132 [Streptomyces sp. PsTaAH-137]